MKGSDVITTTTSSSSSVKSNTTTALEERDSCYYPGCRKDANCNCEICIASINATLDLMPLSVQKSSLTKLSSSHPAPNVERTPLSFDSSFISTPRSSPSPRSRPRPKIESPALKSTARLSFVERKEKEKEKEEKKGRKDWGFVGVIWRFVLGLCLLLAAETVVSWGFHGALRPVLSPHIVRNLGERSWIVQDLRGKLRFLEHELQGFVADGKVSNCSDPGSIWEMNQDAGQLLNSRCVFHKSAIEEVSIWGWPLQTAGLLKTGFSSRSFTVLSGRVTEWSDGKIGYSIRQANTTWIHRKWDASAVQLDPNTWILEYSRSSILDNSRLLSSLGDFLAVKMSRMMKGMSQEFLVFCAFEGQFSEFARSNHAKIPT